MKNLRLLSLMGLLLIYCTKNVNSADQFGQQSAEAALNVNVADQNVNAVNYFVQQIAEAALNGVYPLIDQRLQANPGLINQQNERGQTPLHNLLHRGNVRTGHVVELLKFNPEVLTVGRDRKTLLQAAAAIPGDKTIFQLLVTKTLLDSLTHDGPQNPARDTTAEAYYRELANRLSTVLEVPIAHQELKNTFELLRRQLPSSSNSSENTPIQEFIKFLKVYMHLNNNEISVKTLGDFDIGLHFTTPILRNIINDKNLLQLAGERGNTRLARCICDQIRCSWDLYRLSRAPGAKIIGTPMYSILQENDEISNTISRRFWSLCCGGGLLKIVQPIVIGSASAYIGALIFKQHDSPSPD